MAKPTTPLPASLQADMTARSHQAMRQRFEQPAVAKPRPRADFWRTLENRLRRATDIAVAGSALLLLSPLLLAVAAAIKLEDGGNLVYSQLRVGQRGRLFRMYKLRSMIPNADAQKALLLKQNESAGGVLFKMRRDPRITRVGRFIHRFSIDELPQLWNVLRGDMAIVGPRPALPHEVAKYSPHDRLRLWVKPGLTCLWQIGGRSDIDFAGQVALDIDYIGQQSLLTDWKILLATPQAVISGRGAY